LIFYLVLTVRKPGVNFCNGITTANLGKPDFKKALKQHTEYVRILQECKIAATVLPSLLQFPDGVFVEDTAVLTEKCAVVSNLGAKSRKGEEKSIGKTLRSFYKNIEHIKPPGTLEGGDVLRAENLSKVINQMSPSFKVRPTCFSYLITEIFLDQQL